MTNIKILNELWAEISCSVQEAEILFRKISENEDSVETTVLTELGKKVCKHMRERCIEIEHNLDEIN